MSLKEKKEAFKQLCDTAFVEADRRLLRFHNPASGALTESGGKDRQEKEILWELLDYCGKKVIRDNRQQTEATPAPVPAAELPHQLVAPAKKKASIKRLSMLISVGRILKTRTYKKPLSSIMTGLTALRKCGNWMHNWTISRRKAR